MLVKNEYVIMSAQIKGLPPEINKRRHDALIHVLNDLGANYSVTNGYYDGFTETSVMIRLEFFKGFNEEFFAQIATDNFHQESVLYVDKYNHGRLIYKDKIKYLGKIGVLNSEAVKTSEAWTWIPETNTYLGVV
jgi:hypothetical protein